MKYDINKINGNEIIDFLNSIIDEQFDTNIVPDAFIFENQKQKMTHMN